MTHSHPLQELKQVYRTCTHGAPLLGHSSSRHVVVRGILDSYRRQQLDANPAPTDAPSKAATIQDMPMLTFDSIDEDICPADCVREIFTAADFKEACQVGHARLARMLQDHECFFFCWVRTPEIPPKE
jgi:hypothetical protein